MFQGIPGDILSEVVEPLKANKIPSLKTLGAEYEYVGLNQVRLLGLDDAAVVDLEASTVRWPPTLLAVRRRWEGSPASKLLEDGDVVLSIDGKPVRTYRAVELAVRSKEGVELEVLRGGRKQRVQIPTMDLGTDETRELLLWAGAVLQEPPAAVSRQRGVPREGAYVASLARGSPANWYGLQPTSRVVEVEGVPTPNLLAFLEAVRHKKTGESVRIKQADLRGNVEVTDFSSLPCDHWSASRSRSLSYTHARPPTPTAPHNTRQHLTPPRHSPQRPTTRRRFQLLSSISSTGRPTQSPELAQEPTRRSSKA